jgi:hypothetical protein
MSPALKISPFLALLSLAACTTMPTGPSVLVLPGTGKNFDQFRVEDFECRQFAQLQLGGRTAGLASDESIMRSAAFGTLLGAVAGAAADGGRGAGVGAGAVLALGGLSGTGAGQASGYGVQRNYDYAYLQCMYGRGNRIPSQGAFASDSRQSSAYPPPPPPTGMPPPGPPPR